MILHDESQNGRHVYRHAETAAIMTHVLRLGDDDKMPFHFGQPIFGI